MSVLRQKTRMYLCSGAFRKLTSSPAQSFYSQPPPKKNMYMKTIISTAIFILLSLTAIAEDRLGASDAELARLKQLNTTKKMTSLSDAELRKLMVGRWTTGRHVYDFKADGTWQMLEGSSNGQWRIEGHQLIDNTGTRTIMEASHKQIVLKCKRGSYPYRYARIKKK